MAKCIRCGKSTFTRGHVKLKDSIICTPCFRSLGFKILDSITASAYCYDDIKNGKDLMYSSPSREDISVSKETYKIHGMSYDNDEGLNIQKLLSEFVKEEFRDDKLTASDVKEELEYEDRVYLYPTMDVDLLLEPTVFDGAPAVKVKLETDFSVYEHIGWIPKRDAPHVTEILRDKDCKVSGELIGGPFKYLNSDDKICSDSTEFGGRVYISYRKE